jgi:hypothetical protein
VARRDSSLRRINAVAIRVKRTESGEKSIMAKATTKLNAEDRVILFCAGTGIDHAAVGILTHAMQSMAVRGFIAHNRETECMRSRTAAVRR